MSLDDLETKLLRAGGDVNTITGLPANFETRNTYHEERQVEQVDTRAPGRQPATQELKHYVPSANFSSFAQAVTGQQVVKICNLAYFPLPLAFYFLFF